MSARTWNEHQEEIFHAVESTDDNLVISAYAGTGKTTTIVEALSRVDPNQRIIFVAFNKAIQTELAKRCPGFVDVKTLHSVGYGTIAQNLGKRFQVDAQKAGGILKTVLGNLQELLRTQQPRGIHDRAVFGKTLKLVGLCKNLLEHDPEGIAKVCTRFAIDDEDIPTDTLVSLAATVLQGCAEDLTTIDFDDMVWLPAFKKWKPRRYDLIVIDEAQDLNPAQLYLIEQMARPVRGRRSRVIAVGDDNQAIYGWRGAGTGVLNQIASIFNAKQFPLPVTYRCGLEIVKEARSVVPDFQAHKSTGNGIVRRVQANNLDPERGDFVLSRTNAPLIRLCLEFLRQRMPAVIVGKDIADGLKRLVKQSKTSTIDDLLDWLALYQRRMTKKLDDEKRLEQIIDQCACLRALSEAYDGGDSAHALTADLDSLFSDRDASNMIMLSTVHKAKGLERDRVWMLRDTFNSGKTREENNIFYVAVTRASRELVYVDGIS